MDKWIIGYLKILYELQWLLIAKMYELTLERSGGNVRGSFQDINMELAWID
jgi:hypothetical protein